MEILRRFVLNIASPDWNKTKYLEENSFMGANLYEKRFYIISSDSMLQRKK